MCVNDTFYREQRKAAHQSSRVEIAAMQDSQARTKLSADAAATAEVPSLCAGYEEAAETGDRRGRMDEEDERERPANEEAAVEESHLSADPIDADKDAVPPRGRAAEGMVEPVPADTEAAKQGEAAGVSVMSDEDSATRQQTIMSTMSTMTPRGPMTTTTSRSART
jgi:hypothetical protein